MRKLSVVALAVALTAIAAGCASTAADTASPSASPVLVYPYPTASPYPNPYPYPNAYPYPDTDAPQIDHSDAAGVASVPGVYSVAPDAIVVPRP